MPTSTTQDATNDAEPDACSICLHAFNDRTIIPTCAHEFCFDCILEWTGMSAKPPLLHVLTSRQQNSRENAHYATRKSGNISYTAYAASTTIRGAISSSRMRTQRPGLRGAYGGSASTGKRQTDWSSPLRCGARCTTGDCTQRYVLYLQVTPLL